MKERVGRFLLENWLICLIGAQPVLDDIAYWNQSATATWAGCIRLTIMLMLPLYLLLNLKKKRGLVLAMAVVGAYGALHMLNCVRVGTGSSSYELVYLARVLQMPVLAICFVYLIRNEEMKRQAVKGLYAAGVLALLSFTAACLTGTARATYSEGFGLSGWVIDDNRCANSIILVSLAVFAAFHAVEADKNYVNLYIPATLTVVLIANGTKACYLGLLGILLAYALFLVLEKPLLGRGIRRVPALALAAVLLAAVAAYPFSPRAREDTALGQTSEAWQGEIEAALAELGYEAPDAMTLEEKLNDPRIREVFQAHYVRYMSAAIPDLFERFGYEPVLRYFKMSTDVRTLIDARNIKLAYAALVWDGSDRLTKLLGFGVTELGTDGVRDLENDWPAIFYYYGYLGLALYVGFILFFLWRILRRLSLDFRGSFTLFNFSLLLCLALQLGLAQFSGAILRRPNVSIYMSIVLALIYYQTAEKPAMEEQRL